jgi:transcriptional regulator with XRE-family HTH domain
MYSGRLKRERKMTAKEIFRKRLRIVRIENGFTQRELEDDAKLPYGTIARYESGDRTPELNNFASICEALGESPGWLLDI